MAELAIPIIALGGLYIISHHENNEKKQKSNTKCENYQNLNKAKIESKYPDASSISATSSDSINKYSNSNQSTDKFFLESNLNKDINSNIYHSSITGLTGENFSKENFTHNNMVPFFGGKIRGRTADANTAESILDNMQGTGSQNFSKQEIAPLFNPTENIQFPHGSPDNTDFFQSRQNPSMKMANVTPWEQIHVAPGLNKGYSTQGSDGFNAGMEARAEWMPKTVDELRVATNPKETFGLAGHQGPALAPIKNVGLEGRVEKNLPDKYYSSGPDRWFTTTGAEKAQTSRSETILPVQKGKCSTEYFGIANDGEATYIQGNYESPNRPELAANPLMHAHGKNQHAANSNDYGHGTYTQLPNHRSTTRNDEFQGIYGMGKAVIAPLLDILKPTRKENILGNIRLNGNVNSNDTKHYVKSNDNVIKITNRQMTDNRGDLNHLNVDGAQGRDGYQVSNHIPVKVQRDTTNYKYLGNASGGSNQIGNSSYAAAYNQRNNVNKQQNNAIMPGGTQIFNQYTNLSTIKPDCDRYNHRTTVPCGGPQIISSVQNYGQVQSMQTLSNQTNQSRIQPDILNAFKNNPYTQSLQSIA